MEGVAAILESVGETFGGSAEKVGAQTQWLSGNASDRKLAGSGPRFRRKRRRPEQGGSLVTRRGGEKQGGDRQTLFGGNDGGRNRVAR